MAIGPRRQTILSIVMYCLSTAIAVVGVVLGTHDRKLAGILMLTFIVPFALTMIYLGFAQEDFFRGEKWAVLAPYRRWILAGVGGFVLLGSVTSLISSRGIERLLPVLTAPLNFALWVTIVMWSTRAWLRRRQRRHAGLGLHQPQ